MIDSQQQRWRRILEGGLGVPGTEGNTVDILRNGDEIFPAMLDAIHAAERTVDMVTYVYWTGEIARKLAVALTERGRAGVRVRLLLDAMGARQMDRDLIDDMNDAGVTVAWYRPPTTWKVWENDHRTHRKVLVCDNRVGFVGGVGIAEEWQGDARDPDEWRDTHVRVVGPAVDGLRAAFVTNWRETDHQAFEPADEFTAHDTSGNSYVIVLRSPAQIGWSDLHTMFGLLLDRAERAVNISNAYFVPDDHITDKLCAAAARCVQVRVLVPGPHTDKRVVQLGGEKEYEKLLSAGVEMYHYQQTMLHTKIMTADGIAATIGSGNLDQRSMRLNDECNIVAVDPDVTAQLDAHFEEDLSNAERIDPARWDGRGPVQRVKETVTEVIDHKL